MKKIYLFLVLLNLALLMSCTENTLKPLSSDGVPPGKVQIVAVTPLHGGLQIDFKQPADNDLLIIKAVYDLIGGVKGEVQVSYFENTLKVMGFGDTNERTVKIYAVDRGGNISEPIEVKASPLVCPVKMIQDSLTITADFGGARFTWFNWTEAAVSIEIYAEDSITHKLTKVNTVYTSQKSSRYSVRNMKPVPTLFAAVVRDRWDNVSDTIRPAGSGKLTPLFEEKLNKTKFRKVILASDTKWDAWGFKYEQLYDENFLTVGHTQGDHPWPQIFTIDLGVKTKLSRFRVYQRGIENASWWYSHGNPKKYDVYGAAVLPADPNDLSQWQKLREVCVSTKPSGGTSNTDEDILHGLNGDEYDFDQIAIPSQIRYFRLVVWETWDGAGYVDFAELSWWGNIIEVYN